jgi:alkaline phosphatase D
MALRTHVTRRELIKAGAFGAVAATLPAGRAVAFAPSRPAFTHGIQSGDVTADSAIVWTRADRPSRMVVELSSNPGFRGVRRVEGPVLTDASDFTGKVALRGLAPGRPVFYRVTLEDPWKYGIRSESQAGMFRAAPVDQRSISFVWSGDLAGQGWGINPDFGGYRIFDAMGALDPDFYLCSGDTIYADGPLRESVTLPDGRVWRNLVTPAKQKVAETLDEYRGNFAYNLLDAKLKAFAAHVPQVNQWDDHETHNNWYPHQILADDRYTERRTDVLSARAKQAFFEYLPIAPQRADDAGRIYRKISHGPLMDLFVLDMRTYKDPNDANIYADPERGMLGHEQRVWLESELAASRATWKVIANDLPLGLVVPDTPGTFEGVSQGNNGAPLGRELEFAEVLRTAKLRGVENIVFLTADVHYASAHHYDPARAAVGDFDPFWEFVAGPLNAGAFGPNTLDTTFGPTTVFSQPAPRPNTSPMEGYQFFGRVAIDGRTKAMTVSLHDIDGKVVFQVELPADRPHHWD